MAFQIDSKFNQGAGKRVPVHSQDSCCPALIVLIVPQCRQDKTLLKFSDGFMVEDMPIHHPAHQHVHFALHGKISLIQRDGAQGNSSSQQII